MAAAVPTAIAEAAPAVTIAAGTPSSPAIRAPTFSWSSGTETNHRAASAIACTTSAGISEPPTTVTVPCGVDQGLDPEPGIDALRRCHVWISPLPDSPRRTSFFTPGPPR